MVGEKMSGISPIKFNNESKGKLNTLNQQSKQEVKEQMKSFKGKNPIKINSSVTLDLPTMNSSKEKESSQKDVKGISLSDDDIKSELEKFYLEKMNIGASSMDELNNQIIQLGEEITNVSKEIKDLETEKRTNIDIINLISRLKNGETLEEIMSSPVAWIITDENGDKQTVYEDPAFIGQVASEVITYEDLYKDNPDLLNIKEKLTERETGTFFGFGEKKIVHVFDNSDESSSFLDELRNSLDEDLQNFDNKITDLQNKKIDLSNEKAQKEYNAEYINREIDFYINKVYANLKDSDIANNGNYDKNNDKDLANIFNISKYKDLNHPDYKDVRIDPVTGQIIQVNNQEQIMQLIYGLINNSGEIENDGGVLTAKDSAIKVESSDNLVFHIANWEKFMNDEEKHVFNGIYNSKGYEAAYNYLKSISSELDTRFVTDRDINNSEWAAAHPWASSAMGVLTGPLEGMASIIHSLDSLISGQDLTKTDINNVSDVMRGSVANKITSEYGKGWGFLYSTGMSMADSAVNIGITKIANGGDWIRRMISAGTMGSRSYNSALNAAIDRGLSDESAMITALASALTETAMESYSVGHLLDIETKLNTSAKNFLSQISEKITDPKLAKIAEDTARILLYAGSQGLCEGEEEATTEIMNGLADYIINDILTGELSEHTNAINNYMKQGYSESEARMMANKDFAAQIGVSFLGGLISGITFGSFGAVSENYNRSHDMAQNINKININTTEKSNNQESKTSEFKNNDISKIDNSNNLDTDNSDISTVKNATVEVLDENSNSESKTISGLDRIDVSTLDTNYDVFEDRNFHINTTYDGIDFLYRSENNLDNIIKEIVNSNDLSKKYLIEIKNSNELRFDMVENLPDNVQIRIIGGNTVDYMNGYKSPDTTLDYQKNTYTKNELITLVKILNDFDNGINPNWNDYQKAYYAYNYLKNNIKYEANPPGQHNRSRCFDSFMGLIDGVSTCNGFAYMYQDLCQRMNINCAKIGGKLNGTGAHAYNIVKIDENIFIVDTVREMLSKDSAENGFANTSYMNYSAKNNSDLLYSVNSDISTIKDFINNDTTVEVLQVESDVKSKAIVEDLNSVIQTLQDKYNCSEIDAINYMRDVINAQDYNAITRDNNARDIIKQYSFNDLGKGLDQIMDTFMINFNNQNNNILKIKDQFNDIMQLLHDKRGYSKEESLQYLNDVLNDDITGDKDIIDFVMNYSINDLQTVINDLAKEMNYDFINKEKNNNDFKNIEMNKFDGHAMKDEINGLINPKWSLLEKARKLYIELNKRVSYDISFFSGNPNLKQSIYNEDITFGEMTSNKLVCKGWSQLFYELLLENGFTSDNVKIMGGNSVGSHKWIEIDFGKQIIIADATDPLNHGTDLARCKIGSTTDGFVYTDKSLSGQRLIRIFYDEEYNLYKYGRDSLRKLDEKIGYIDKKYFEESLNSANKLFENSSFANKFTNDHAFNDEIINFDESSFKGMDGMDAYVYLNILKHNISSLKTSNVEYGMYPSNGRYNSIAILQNDEGYMIYSEDYGVKKFSDSLEYYDFLNKIKFIEPKG